jgi:hypothetical protein
MDGVSVDIFESNTHSFIIKIWLEESVEEAGRARWRGYITHVPSGERSYLKDLDDIVAFMAPYLEGMGLKLGYRIRMRNWIRQLRTRSKRLFLRQSGR